MQNVDEDHSRWAKGRLYFDGARVNPGPGGSGWCLAIQESRTAEWGVRACGYDYNGAAVANNLCEYAVLQAGATFVRAEFQHTCTHLEVSHVIINACNGFATMHAKHLQHMALTIKESASDIAWTSWTHTKRANNTAADHLVNRAMDSCGHQLITIDSTGEALHCYNQVQTKLDNDLLGTPSMLRHTSLTKAIRQFQGS